MEENYARELLESYVQKKTRRITMRSGARLRTKAIMMDYVQLCSMQALPFVTINQ